MYEYVCVYIYICIQIYQCDVQVYMFSLSLYIYICVSVSTWFDIFGSYLAHVFDIFGSYSFQFESWISIQRQHFTTKLVRGSDISGWRRCVIDQIQCLIIFSLKIANVVGTIRKLNIAGWCIPNQNGGFRRKNIEFYLWFTRHVGPVHGGFRSHGGTPKSSIYHRNFLDLPVETSHFVFIFGISHLSETATWPTWPMFRLAAMKILGSSVRYSPNRLGHHAQSQAMGVWFFGALGDEFFIAENRGDSNFIDSHLIQWNNILLHWVVLKLRQSWTDKKCIKGWTENAYSSKKRDVRSMLVV